LKGKPGYLSKTFMEPAAGRTDPNAMPLKDFINELMAIVTPSPDTQGVCVERVGFLRGAEAQGGYEQSLEQFNDAMSGEN
jgi:uncharacterized oxidoreductase